MMVHSITSILGAKGSTLSVNAMPVSSNIAIINDLKTPVNSY